MDRWQESGKPFRLRAPSGRARAIAPATAPR